MPFEQLGPYRLGKKLGQGGMGAVYEGVDTETGEAAAIKVLSPALAVDEGFRVRFEAEIDSLKKLRHPNIVRLYGYGEQAGTLFYAMELVPGTSLEDELRRGRRFDWREVTQIAVKLCRALKHAHDHGVIHRDLKPANLLLTADGDVKLSDFGIARLFGNTRLTSDGGVLGTAEYMSPEQAEGKTVTDRSDQYSLGGVMYALLTGRPPFKAETVVQMLQLQRYAEPEPVDRLAPGTPDELARIIHQLLEKDPQKRFPNALILSRSLEAIERGLSITGHDDEDFLVIPPEKAGVEASGYDPAAPTLSPTQLREAELRRQALEASGFATEATMAYAPRGEKRPGAPAPLEELPDRFTKVQERREEPSRLREALATVFTPQTLAPVGALAALAAIGWYLMQPPSADQLYRRIEVAMTADDPDQIKAVAGDVDAFLARFPQDPRAEKVQELADAAKESGPIERAYGDALRQARLNPDVALEKFQALIDVYDDGQQGSEVAALRAASRMQTARLQKKVDRYVADGRKLLESRLDKATTMAASDPVAARKIFEGVVALYREKPWAADLVRRAEDALQTASQPQTAAE